MSYLDMPKKDEDMRADGAGRFIATHHVASIRKGYSTIFDTRSRKQTVLSI